MRKLLITSLAMIAGAATMAQAHVTLEVQEASVGAAYKATFRVGHGCEGSPTVKISVQIPEGYFSVKPMPKAGWKLETVRGKYAKEYDYFGTKLTEGVKEVIWSGGVCPTTGMTSSWFVARWLPTSTPAPSSTFRSFRIARRAPTDGSKSLPPASPPMTMNFRRRA